VKVVIQRSKTAQVTVNQEVIGAIDKGLVLLVGITHEDNEQVVQKMADKIVSLRIFEDAEEKMNLDVLQAEGAILSVSQFTLYADCRKGRRPNFLNAAKPDAAERLYDYFNSCLRDKRLQVETGQFGAMMDVQLTNDGPVTIILDSAEIM